MRWLRFVMDYPYMENISILRYILVFHIYMRPAVRLTSLMHQPVFYIYTHDSIFVGEDGPAHQPIGILESMRLILDFGF